MRIKQYTIISEIVTLSLVIMLSILSISCATEPTANIPVDIDGSDTDKDGLTDQQEIALGTDQKNPDTDNDGLRDRAEIDMFLDPLDPDMDKDGVLDSDDFLPKFSNARFYLYIGLTITFIFAATLIFIHMRYGLSQRYRDKLMERKRLHESAEDLSRQISENIRSLAGENKGYLKVDNTADVLGMEPELVVKYFKRLKAEKKDDYYRFCDIADNYEKKGGKGFKSRL